MTAYTVITVDGKLKLVGPGYESKLFALDCRSRLEDLRDLMNQAWAEGVRHVAAEVEAKLTGVRS